MADETERLDPRVLRIVGVMLVGGIAVLFDSTIVAIALDTLSSALHAPLSSVQWVATGYLLALGVAVPLAAWAQGRIGGKRLWLVGLALFLAGSVAASLAPGIGALVAARAVQGLGGGLLLPLMTTLPMQAAGGRVSGRMVAVVSLPMVLGPVLGPLVGGAVLHWLSWRWMFWINVPLVVAGFVLARRHLPDDVPTRRARLDWVGAILLPFGLVGVLEGLSQVSGHDGFADPAVLVPMLGGLALVAAFAWHALRAGAAALIDVRLLRVRSVGSSSAAMFVAGASLYGAMVLLPLFWQQVRGDSALMAGVLLVAQGVGSALSRPIAGTLTDRAGARWVTSAGFAIVALATLPFALAGASTPTWWLVLALVVRGFGLGGVIIPVMAVAFRDTTPDQVPHASVLTRISQQVGGAFGTAVLAVVLESAVRAGGAGGAVDDAFHTAFWWATAFAVLAVVACQWLPGRRARTAAAPAADGVSREPATVEA